MSVRQWFRVTNDYFTIKKYETDFSWLYWSMTKNGYICKICELAAESGQPHKLIDKGVLLGTHPSRKLEKHKSNRHITSVSKYTNYRSKSVQSMWSKFCAAACDEMKNVSTRKYFENMVRCAYFMIRKRWALSINFEELVRFIADLC